VQFVQRFNNSIEIENLPNMARVDEEEIVVRVCARIFSGLLP